MPAPKGNKNAVGNKGGRPEKWTKEKALEIHNYYKKYGIQKTCILINKTKGNVYDILKKFNLSVIRKRKYNLENCITINDKMKARYNQNPQLKIKNSVSSSIRDRLKSRNSKKVSKTDNIIGCNFEFFINYLQSNLKKGMNLDNYGLWQIDHIIPDSWFKYNNENDKQFKQSWHYTNLKPIWKKENIKKSNFYSENSQLNLLI